MERSLGLPADLLALNNCFERELSFLSPEKAARLVDQAFMACRIGEADALLLAFDQDAQYDNPNFQWFRERFDRFVYIDRVVVAPEMRGRGLAGALYRALFREAAAHAHVRVVCEVNWNPPNPESDAFHAGLGFEQVGLAILPGAGKTVRYFSRAIV
ncbi:MAG TPA: GNAT family N-acetyltransferase [Rhizomicrobium sp.]|nr:GNAT family N-acetyltransferase [Rhizomicrobium sp.]